MEPGTPQVLLQTTVNALGQPIEYPRDGTPEVTAFTVELAPGEKYPWHRHPFPLLGYILEGELTVRQVTGQTRVVGPGGVSLESVGVVHQGSNEGTVPCRMIVFVVGLKGVPFTEKVPHACLGSERALREKCGESSGG